MKTKQKKWRSPSLGKDMTITIYGYSGTPIIGMPTRGANTDQWARYGMISAIASQLENGYNQLFCVDSVDNESLLNKHVEPHKRIMRHLQYETYLLEEVIPYIREENSNHYLIIAGIDLGGYHAVNMALKYPDIFDKVIGISGLYDIKEFFGDFYSDRLYFNNPVDFMSNLNTQSLLNGIRKTDFRFVSYLNDPRKFHATKISNIFRTKFIDYTLDIWNLSTQDEWNFWQRMLKTHII